MTRTLGAALGGLAILCGLLGTLPAAAAAQGDECIVHATTTTPRGEMSHFSADASRDLGGGLVAQSLHAGSEGDVSTHVNFHHCASGGFIRATVSRSTDGEAYSAPTDPADLVREAIASPVTFDLEGVVELLRSRGIEAELLPSEFESCGCAVFYPELVGDKTPWPG